MKRVSFLIFLLIITIFITACEDATIIPEETPFVGFAWPPEYKQELQDRQNAENIRELILKHHRIQGCFVIIKSNPSAASVMLTLEGTDMLTTDDVQFIIDSILSVIPAMNPDNITISDNELRLYGATEYPVNKTPILVETPPAETSPPDIPQSIEPSVLPQLIEWIKESRYYIEFEVVSKYYVSHIGRLAVDKQRLAMMNMTTDLIGDVFMGRFIIKDDLEWHVYDTDQWFAIFPLFQESYFDYDSLPPYSMLRYAGDGVESINGKTLPYLKYEYDYSQDTPVEIYFFIEDEEVFGYIIVIDSWVFQIETIITHQSQSIPDELFYIPEHYEEIIY